MKLATHFETGQKVAVKIIPKSVLKPKERKNNSAHEGKTDQERDETAVNKKLEREIAIMKLIQHPSVMALYDVYESPEELYLVLELVEGGELFDYLVKQGRLKELDALNFFQQIIAGVDYCHKHLICHRDLKPENLLLDSQGKIKIADFGMASLQVSGRLLETSCGSPHYASPEVIKGVKYDGSSADIWSCGVILYALLTGNLPFDDENIRKLLQKVKTGIFTVPEYIPKDASDLIKRMLVVNPESRIKIEDIQKHPWFLKMPYKWKTSGDGPLRTPPSVEATKSFTGLDSELDEDILNSLSILGYGTADDIIKALRNPDRNYEKVFYFSLKQRKTEFLEKYDNDYDDSSRNLHRRTGSRTSVFNDRNSVHGSQDMLSLKKTEDDASKKQVPKPSDRRSVVSSSPLAVQTSFTSSTDKGIEENYVLASPQPQKPVRKQSIFDQIRNKFVAATPEDANSQPDISIVDKQLVPAINTKLHIDNRHNSVSNSSPDILKDIDASVSSLNSPAISSGPKKSWFANLFQFKPEIFVTYSSEPLGDTKTTIEKHLQTIGVQYQYSRDGVSLKCKYDCGGTLPFVKFRIGLTETDGGKVEILSTQQQGSLSTFQIFFERFKSLAVQ